MCTVHTHKQHPNPQFELTKARLREFCSQQIKRRRRRFIHFYCGFNVRFCWPFLNFFLSSVHFWTFLHPQTHIHMHIHTNAQTHNVFALVKCLGLILLNGSNFFSTCLLFLFRIICGYQLQVYVSKLILYSIVYIK